LLGPLAQVAQATRAAMIPVRHLNKGGQGQRALYRGSGSIAISGAARSAFLVGRSPADDDLCVLACTKTNLAVPPPSLGFRIPRNAEGQAIVVWTGAVDISADELVLTRRTPHGQVLDQAKDFLLQLLKGGSCSSEEAHRMAHEAGITTRTLRRAREELGLRSELKCTDDGRQWVWSLPPTVVGQWPELSETVRGYSNVGLLVIDEAARVPDDLYRTVRPMLAVSDGRLVCLSTPYGKRGFFYNAWARGGADWHRIEVPADKIARLKPSVLESDRRELGESWYRQEYGCSFEALEGLVYADFARCVVAGPAPDGTRVGGMDFGLRNPFAAIWGVFDRDGVLWLTGEHYSRDKSLAFHAEHLPRDVTWYGDPTGARDIKELHCAGFTIRRGDNDQRPGIAAVRARLENGMLRVVQGSCPNLLAEAGLYQYDPEATDSETPKKEHDHALDALRYLVSRIDSRFMARARKRPVSGEAAPETPPPAPPVPAPRTKKWLSIHNEELWTRLW